MAKLMKLNKVCLTRSNQKILDSLDAEWPGSGVVVLLGANGAGKSTLLNLLAGIDTADSGSVELPQGTTQFMLPEPAKFYPQLSVSEQLSFVAALSGNDINSEQLETLLNAWQLTSVKDKLTKHLSLGYRQRLSLAQLDLSDADVFLMDEPMNGMDPDVMSVFKAKVNSWKQDKSIVMATHILHEAQEFADWVVVMEQGKIIASKAYQQDEDFQSIYHNAINHHHALLQQKSNDISSGLHS